MEDRPSAFPPRLKLHDQNTHKIQDYCRKGDDRYPDIVRLLPDKLRQGDEAGQVGRRRSRDAEQHGVELPRHFVGYLDFGLDPYDQRRLEDLERRKHPKPLASERTGQRRTPAQPRG